MFNAVTSDFPDSDKICGVRLLDKSNSDRPGIYRIEIWTKFNDPKEYANLIDYIE